MALYHVNFHTLYGKPIFENEAYDHMMSACLCDVLRARRILCPAWEIMPTHVPHPHHHHHPGQGHPPASISPSILRLSVLQRLAIAAALIALLWGAVIWAMKI